MSSSEDGRLAAGSDAPLLKRARLDVQLPSAVQLPSTDPPLRADELRARLPHFVAEQHEAERARTLVLIALAEREVLSPAEEVLAIPYLSKRSIMSFLKQEEALSLRAASRACCEAVAEHAWSDYEHDPYAQTRSSHIKGSLALWRRCFPRATAANVSGRRDLTDADFVDLRGIRKLNMRFCKLVTDAGLEYLSGIHTLYMSHCALVTDAGLAHLSGIHTLNMGYCKLITDAGLAHLGGIHTLYMYYCTLVTDAGLAHLSGVHTLDMRDCALVTDVGLAHLSGIHTLDISYCPLVSDAGLVHLAGIRDLTAYSCPLFTIAGRAQLRVGGAMVHP